MGLLQEIKSLIDKNRSSAIIAASVLLVVVSILVMFLFMNTKADKVLFTGLSNRDISAVTDALIVKGIDYKIDEKKGSILVPDKQSDNARMYVMTEGVLSNSRVGFEIFDNSEFGMTEFSQKINYKRALEGELSRTISSLDEIKYARVHIVQPSSKLFQRKDDKASASIILFLKNDQYLASKKIIGIQNIVASSVDGLSLTNVVVSNQAGEVLSTNHNVDGNKDAHKLSQKEIQEQYYINKISQVLNSSVGKNNYSVSVNIELDYTRLSKTTENYVTAKDGQIVARERTSKNKNGDVVSSDYEYRYGKVIESTEEELGRIKKIQIGIVVPINTSDDQISKLKDIIEMAGGIDKERGDMVAIHNTGLASNVLSHSPDKLTESYKVTSAITQSSSKASIEPMPVLLPELTSKYGISQNQIVFFALFIIILSVLVNIYYIFMTKSSKKNLSETDKQKVLDEVTAWFDKGNQRVSE